MSNEFVIYKTDNLAGGWNPSTDSWVGAPNGIKPNEAIFCKNCFFWDGVSVRSRNGFKKKEYFYDSSTVPLKRGAEYAKSVYLNGEHQFFVRSVVQATGGGSIYLRDYLSGLGMTKYLLITQYDPVPDEDKYVEVIAYNDIIYVIDNDSGYKWDAINVRLSDFGIDAPASACTASVGGSGTLTGTYVYYYSFYNSETQTESALSPVSGTVSPSSQYVDLTNIAVSSDSQVDKRKIYRQGAGSDVIFYCGVINDNTTTTYVDNTSTLSVEQTCSDNGVVREGSLITHHHQLIFISGNFDNNIY